MNLEKLTRLAEREVAFAMSELPPDVRRNAESVPVFFEGMPGPGDLASGIEQDTLGLFDEGEADVPVPRIRLWLENVWDFSERDEEIFRDEVRITFLHELGHFLGWDEEELEERGLD